MLSPLPVDAIKSFCADCREVLVPELNYEGQFAHLLTGATGCAVQRFNRVSAGRCRSTTSWPRSAAGQGDQDRAAVRRRVEIEEASHG